MTLRALCNRMNKTDNTSTDHVPRRDDGGAEVGEISVLPRQSGSRGRGECPRDDQELEIELGHLVDGRVDAGQRKSRCRSGMVEGCGLGGPPNYLGKNKEVYEAEVYAIYRALKIIDQRGEDGHQFTISSYSASAVDRTCSDTMDPSQRLAIAIHEVGERIVGHNNTVTTRWVPAHQGVEGNEVADT